MRGFRGLDALLVLGNGASKCNMVSFNVSAISKLMHGNFFNNIDGDFSTNENAATASMPINNVQSHANIIS